MVVATQMELMLKSEGVLHMEEEQDWPLIEKVEGGKKLQCMSRQIVKLQWRNIFGTWYSTFHQTTSECSVERAKLYF